MRVKHLFKICSNRNTAILHRQPHGKRAEEDPADREGLERLAAAYLEHFGEDDIAVRFDIVSMMVLGDSRGFLRLHRNALSAL